MRAGQAWTSASCAPSTPSGALTLRPGALPQANPDKWTTLDRATAELGFKTVTLLKCDIEGFEYDVVASSLSPAAKLLPQQISLELHYAGLFFGTPAFKAADDFSTSQLFWPLHELSVSDLSLFMSHLAGLGYAIVSREDNPLCPSCTELTLLRVSQPPF